MANETTITLTGAITAEPELRFTGSGDAVANFTVATNSRRFDKQADKWVDNDAMFMRCSAWRQLGEHVAESLSKGDRVIVTGSLRQRSYEKDGVNRTVFELQVTEVGASLQFATVKINKATRATSTEQAPVSVPDDDSPPF